MLRYKKGDLVLLKRPMYCVGKVFVVAADCPHMSNTVDLMEKGSNTLMTFQVSDSYPCWDNDPNNSVDEDQIEFNFNSNFDNKSVDIDNSKCIIHSKSSDPLRVAEKEFKPWYYCTKCGHLMERFVA